MPTCSLPVEESATRDYAVAMLGALQRQKLERKFRIFDANGDGFVQRDDFDIIIENLHKMRNLTADSDEAKAISEQYLEYWNALRKFADENEDHQVSLEEWLEYHDAAIEFEMILKEHGEQGTLQPFADVLFQLIDRNGDGRISAEEYREFLSVYKLDASAADQAFEHLDQHQNGFLTREEMASLVFEFYASDEPSTAGNWLFGPI